MKRINLSKSNYGMTLEYSGTFKKAESSIKKELAKEGFGILTEIDVSSTLKKKLDIDYPRYKILGACNPAFAYEALKAEKEIGLLLPCNVIVYEKDNVVFVSAMLPTAALGLVDNPTVAKIAEAVEKKLKSALVSLSR